MTGAGRPLRFLLLVLGAWIGLRTWQLWPEPPVPPAARDAVRRVMAHASAPAVPAIDRAASVAAPAPRMASAAQAAPAIGSSIGDGGRMGQMRAIPVDSPEVPVAAATPVEETPAFVMGLLGMVRYGTPAPPTPTARRWSASAWTIVRASGVPEFGAGVATPQLGGAQAGVRIARTLDPAGRFAIAGRFAAALGTRQQEAAVGIEWRPLALPVRVVAERRFGVANQRDGTAVGLVGGVSDRALPAGFRLDGYAQAGAVVRDDVEGYADGAVQVARPVLGRSGGVAIALGVGLWGAAQRGAARLDVGPSATIEVPTGAVPRVRVALEWRRRVAGDARPASGPALSIGTDF
ncbi:hypothetical protein J2Y58_002419 [Sphingomonas sp. BE138]|uniref:hypothetical protein n=1 Tax=Sphingomonas sp. BE138 TaxID=2817845 RepID=UPI002857CF9C|nr:hypothetical protein [Sphingomonas sp. BE138]MDR6789050.1 hypothetical protein [Sphingomonas sp. BE138]